MGGVGASMEASSNGGGGDAAAPDNNEGPAGAPPGAEFLRKRSFVDTGDGGQAKPRHSQGLVAANRRRSSIDTGKTKPPKSVFDSHTAELPRWKEKLDAFLENPYVSGFMLVITIWALFGDDIRLIATYEDADAGFEVMTIICIILFGLELILGCLAKPKYFLGFYFWLDLVATLSLLFDIQAFMDAITNADDDDVEEGGDGGTAEDQATLARASRASKAGARAGRIVRLVRLVRIVKLYKSYQQRKQREQMGLPAEEFSEFDEEPPDAQSRVGQKLSDLTTRRVIMIVLVMVMAQPAFEESNIVEPLSDTVVQNGIEQVHFHTLDFAANPETGEPCSIPSVGSDRYKAFQMAMTSYVEASDDLMYQLYVCDKDFSKEYGMSGEDQRELRPTERDYFAYRTSYVRFNVRWESQVKAILSMLRTLFVCVILGAGALSFSKDANDLVLRPIERMIKKVRDMTENPLMRQHIDNTDSGEEQFETKILENSISKICSLLAVGFGDAGAEIIAENMKQGGDLNPMVPGRKMCAIFGFCDIRQFTDTTEVLQEDVMEFVNSIAKIVHMEVALHGGSANKNIGDAFLLVWKFESNITLQDVQDINNIKESKRRHINAVADKAMASFVIIQAALKKSARLFAYSKNPALTRRLPNYRVKMGLGLHVGWAIEGAIGSEYKVDASYLSPNVNMASRLEAATKQFGTPLLLSEDFVGILSQEAQAKTRQIDCVTVKGSETPMGLYTYDTDTNLISDPEYPPDPNRRAEDDTHSFVQYAHEFDEHPDICALHSASPEFLATFKVGFEAYRDGRWDVAREVLQGCASNGRKTLNGEKMEDGPSVTLLSYMEDFNFRAPSGWKGFRELTEK